MGGFRIAEDKKEIVPYFRLLTAFKKTKYGIMGHGLPQEWIWRCCERLAEDSNFYLRVHSSDSASRFLSSFRNEKGFRIWLKWNGYRLCSGTVN
jgi:hypothetical protein